MDGWNLESSHYVYLTLLPGGFLTNRLTEAIVFPRYPPLRDFSLLLFW